MSPFTAPDRAAPQDRVDIASALIDQIMRRFHDGHREQFPRLLVLADGLPAAGPTEGLAADVQRLVDALEQHMFKEEMRLFPMMVQGGHTLIEQLIDDLQAEHAEQDAALAALRSRLQALAVGEEAAAALPRLLQGVEQLAAELELHVQAEDRQLFPMFQRRRPVAGSPR
jgi:regulator of cell morphogenesis and NO signaling